MDAVDGEPGTSCANTELDGAAGKDNRIEVAEGQVSGDDNGKESEGKLSNDERCLAAHINDYQMGRPMLYCFRFRVPLTAISPRLQQTNSWPGVS